MNSVWIVLSVDSHFGSIVTAVHTEVRVCRVFDSPEKADRFKQEIEQVNKGTLYTIEQMEVR